MKICVYGAGAVGGALAVRLCKARADVSVVARGEHARAIREQGLTLVAGQERLTVVLPCVEDPRELPVRPDVLFVTVKQTQLPAIAQVLAEFIARGSRVVLAMNGIPWWFAAELPLAPGSSLVESLDPGGALRQVLDTKSLISAVVQSSSEVIAPGVVLSTTPGRNRLILGAVDPHHCPALDGLLDLLGRAGYEARQAADIRFEIWNKMALWVAVSPISALTGRALDELVAEPRTFGVMCAIMREMNLLGRQLGFELPDSQVEEKVGFYRDKPTRPSLLKDVELGREPELASGILVFDEVARGLGMPAQHLQTVAALCAARFGRTTAPA